MLANTARQIAGTSNDQLLGVYEAVFAKLPRPKAMAEQFTRHTAWRLLGEDYARLLTEHGRPDDARDVLGSMGTEAGG